MLVIRAINPDSLADQAGFIVGDAICSINGETIRDLIDFQVHSGEEHLVIEVERANQTYEVEICRTENDVLGFEFADMKLRRCNNKCVFCFIHQMPDGMRRSLYFEDDDYRLSFLHGSYVTLTNVKEGDLDRIVEQGLSPQYISVHATNPDVRQHMLGRRLQVDILERIGRLAAGGIEMHAQIVLCPGLNDGTNLERTLSDLYDYYPHVRSVALVPVGLTRYRLNLPEVQPVDDDKVGEYVEQAERWGTKCRQKLGERFVYCADELFVRHDTKVPAIDYYDAFPQLENGIGMVRQFLDKWRAKSRAFPLQVQTPCKWGFVTGRLAEPFMTKIVGDLNDIDGLVVELLPVDNTFFGNGITVSGLLTGRDILAKIMPANWDAVFLPPNCINGEGLTLDDMTVGDLSRSVGCPLGVGSYDLYATLQNHLCQFLMKHDGTGRQLSEQGFVSGR